MADIINFNPNTGAKLSPGEIVFDKNTNTYIQQGTPFGTTVQPTVQYNTDTGAKLKTGESTIVNGVSQVAGSAYTGANAYGANSNVVNYNTDTGAMLKPGETTTYNGQTVAQGQTISLPTASAPISTATINNSIPQTNLPTATPSSGNISGAVAASSGLSQYYATQSQQEKANADAYQKMIEQQQKSPEAQASQSFLQKLLSAPSPDQVRKNAEAQTGINPTNYFAEEKARLAEIESLTTQYNSLKAQKDAAIAKSSDKLASNSFINNQIAQIERNAAPALNELSANINAKAAIMQAEQGRFNEAQNYINQAVQDATAQQKFNMDMYNEFYSINQDAISRLDKKYESALQASKDDAEKAYQIAYDEKTQIGKMMIDPQLRGAGITMTDTLEQAYAKAQKVSGANYLADQSVIHGGSGGETSTAAFTDVLQSAIDQGATPQEAARAAAAVSEAQGIPVNQKMLNDLLNQANQLQKRNTTIQPGNQTSTPVSAKALGQSVVNSPIYQAFNPSNLYQGAKDVVSSVGSFFSGLFGG